MLVVLLMIAIFVITIVMKGVIIVRQAEVIIVERLGRFHKIMNSGLRIVIPIIDKCREFTWRQTKQDYKGNRIVQVTTVSRLDLRETVYDFPGQKVITADNVIIVIDAIIYFQVTDPFKAIYEINNLPEAIEKLTQTSLRNVVGELDLDRTLTSRDEINTKLRDILDDAADKWGIKVNRVELQDITPPVEIRNAMEKQMRAERDKRATILEAEGKKQADILEAEGCRNAQITRAEGEAKSKLLVAEAEAESIRKIQEALKETKMDPAEYQIALKYIAAFNDIVQKGDKTVLLPYESSALLGSVKTIKEIFK